MVLKKIKCKKCGYEWIPKIQKPKSCPSCKQYQEKKSHVTAR
uniref:Uncharacterized protein n=1 Tax=viral metagenome TaxID=1070528 RepID=A0A6H2A626_9ZZZZ